MPRYLASVVPLLCACLTGCVRIPPTAGSSGSEKEALAAHVRFLAQPALKGRKTGTAGSRTARAYIENQFNACGLVPWARAKTYDLEFGYGHNIAGVLLGSDPQLKKEIVLVSAHYDHLGKDHQGRICPGAADNASGVAALLEIARQMSALEPRPRRSVAFVAFDSEEMMMLGSFAFTCRKDVQEAKLAAVINMDMLGRDLLDVVQNTVFVAGTESYPELGEKVRQVGTNAGIRVLPLGTDLIGPRSDHVAFESRVAPCLFFSCGTFKDYHEPTDTEEKLDYATLEASAKVVLATVREVANSNSSLISGKASTPASAAITRRLDSAPEAELRSVCIIMDEVGQHSDAAGIKKEDVDALRKLAAEARELLKSGRYNRAAREQLILDATGPLVPYFMPRDDGKKTASPEEKQETASMMQFVQQFYLDYGPQLMEGYRQLVAQLLKYRPGIFRRMPPFHFEIYDIPDENISIKETAPGIYELNVLINHWTLKAGTVPWKWWFKSFGGSMVGFFETLDCSGTKEQLSDCCLLALRAEQSNALHSAGIKKVLAAVAGAQTCDDYGALMQARLRAGGFKDETEWVASCMLSGSPGLALPAIEAGKTIKDARIRKSACQLIRDDKVRPDVRAAAVELAGRTADRDTLLSLCDLITDSTVAYQPEYMTAFRPDYVFADRPAVKTMRPLLEKQMRRAPSASKTLGELAAAQLKNAAKKDFGNDAQRWREWVNRAFKQGAVDSLERVSAPPPHSARPYG